MLISFTQTACGKAWADKNTTWLTIVCKYSFSASTSSVSQEAERVIWTPTTSTKLSHRHQAVTSPTPALPKLLFALFFNVNADMWNSSFICSTVKFIYSHFYVHLVRSPAVGVPFLLFSLCNCVSLCCFSTDLASLGISKLLIMSLIWLELPLSLPDCAVSLQRSIPPPPLKCYCMTWHQKKWQSQWGLSLKKNPKLSPAMKTDLLRRGSLLDRQSLWKASGF